MADHDSDVVVSTEQPGYPASVHLVLICLAVMMVPTIIANLAGFPRVARALFITIVIGIAGVTFLWCSLASGSYEHEEE